MVDGFPDRYSTIIVWCWGEINDPCILSASASAAFSSPSQVLRRRSRRRVNRGNCGVWSYTRASTEGGEAMKERPVLLEAAERCRPVFSRSLSALLPSRH